MSAPEIPEDIWDIAEAIVAAHDLPEVHVVQIADAILAERERCDELLRNPNAVLVNWLRGGINADSIIAEIIDRNQTIAREYAASYEKALPLYGQSDKDAGRGRQEGHIKAGYDIADAIRNSRSKAIHTDSSQIAVSSADHAQTEPAARSGEKSAATNPEGEA